MPVKDNRIESATSAQDPVEEVAAETSAHAGFSINYKSYDSDRMVVLFTIANDGVEVPGAISTEALDHLDGVSRTKENLRESQFVRLHEKIEARAAKKFRDSELEGRPAGIILRSIDFRN